MLTWTWERIKRLGKWLRGRINDAASPTEDLNRDMVEEPILPAVNELRVHRITDIQDTYIYQTMRLHNQEFYDAIRDSEANMVRWIEQMKDPKINKFSCCDDILLIGILTSISRIAAYLYAQHYNSSKFIFISYIAIDRPFARELHDHHDTSTFHLMIENATSMLFDELRKVTGYPERVKGVIAEVDRGGQSNELKRIFRLYASRNKLRAYRIDCTYMQPPLILSSADNIIAQDLIFIPGSQYQWKMGNNMMSLSKSEVLDIMGFIYKEVYVDSYLGDSQYEAYRDLMERMYCSLTTSLPPIIKLIPL